MSTFERLNLYKFSYYFVLWRIYKTSVINSLFKTVLNRKITCNFHDHIYFVKMMNIFHILQGIFKFMGTTVYYKGIEKLVFLYFLKSFGQSY